MERKISVNDIVQCKQLTAEQYQYYKDSKNFDSIFLTNDMYKWCEQEAECKVLSIDHQDGMIELTLNLKESLSYWFPMKLIISIKEIRLEKLNKILKI